MKKCLPSLKRKLLRRLLLHEKNTANFYRNYMIWSFLHKTGYISWPTKIEPGIQKSLIYTPGAENTPFTRSLVSPRFMFVLDELPRNYLLLWRTSVIVPSLRIAHTSISSCHMKSFETSSLFRACVRKKKRKGNLTNFIIMLCLWHCYKLPTTERTKLLLKLSQGIKIIRKQYIYGRERALIWAYSDLTGSYITY